MIWKLPISKKNTMLLLLAAALIVFAAFHLDLTALDEGKGEALQFPASTVPQVEPGLDELPNPADFQLAAQNDKLRLLMDPKTGHFKVEDKRSGSVWHSYPNPEQWEKEDLIKEGSLWRYHLRSPVMFQYMDFSDHKSSPKDANMISENGTIKDLQMLPDGFKLTFDMPSKQIAVPVEVKLEDDSVVTRILDEGLSEGSLSLIWIRLYPFFGAQQSADPDGYMFIPDGSGALMKFRDNHMNVNKLYREPVYGQDLSFKVSNLDGTRSPAMMPVFGIKSGAQGFISVVEDGAEYADITASPAGVFGRYNWNTAQMNYRSTFKQVTNAKKNRSFITYNKEERFGSDRVVRYMLLDKADADYVGMAARYRQYLMEKHGLKKLEPKSSNIPLEITLLGADTETGFVKDKYLKQTTTAQAKQIVSELHELGIKNMTVHYKGWQNGGYSSSGGLLPVDSRIGGNEGMKQLVEFAHSLDIPVYLDADYSSNNSGRDGFRKRNHGLRDMGGSPIRDLVSLKFLDKVIDKDMEAYQSLGIDGLRLTGLGRYLNSDFNSKYAASRHESLQLQGNIFDKFKEGVGQVQGTAANFYTLPYVNSISRLPNDYSYDLFSDSSVPFAQIALHGLISYTSEYINERQQYRNDFLRDLEYGVNPSFIFTYSNEEKSKYTKGLHLFSSNYAVWEQAAVEEYRIFNEVLGSVQGQFIAAHRTLADKVKETTYEDGTRVIVNYNPEPYVSGDTSGENSSDTSGGIRVEGQSYIVIRGGGTK
ncbi:DUF5696 domain-containing protein [Paenibacillus eucommiae]|uniref:Uncharacterized protein n=1 Tax=Paenibacillus eucommiae TaxID=1355755 RepID=A0ABS4IT71_9BACL|nr:DUF5696 domain-containing protein [Paenibacillus eucommiae]MBP1990765.1 hypothetical protein [Paenibacillus eucommiae]